MITPHSDYTERPWFATDSDVPYDYVVNENGVARITRQGRARGLPEPLPFLPHEAADYPDRED